MYLTVRCINAYDLINKIKSRIIEWDYCGQSGEELIEFIEKMVDDIPSFYTDEDLFNSMCRMYR